MRKLAYCAGGYTLALLLAHYLLPADATPWLAAALGLLSLPAFWLKGKAKLAVPLVLISAGVGFLWNWAHWQIFIRPADSLAGESRTVQAVLLECDEGQGGYTRADVLLSEKGLPRTKVVVYDYDGTGMLGDLSPGQLVSIHLRFFSALERRGAAIDTYSSRGIYVRASCIAPPEVLGQWRFRWLLLPRALSRLISAQADACYPEDAAAFMKALLTGDRTEFYADTEAYLNLQTAGISHIIAVSGLHVSFLIGAVQMVLGRKRASSLVGIPLVFLFMAMTGFTPSVVRAGVMQTLLLLAPLLRREEDTITSLSAALLLILLPNPQSIGSVSLQLSFGAMAGITVLSGRIYDFLCEPETVKKQRLLRSAALITADTCGVMAFTVPLLALHFGYVPLYSLLSNLLCLWVASVCFVGGYITCLSGLVYPALGSALGWAFAWPARYILTAARLIAKLPYAALYTQDNFVAWWIAFVYGVFILCYLLKGGERFRPVFPLCACVITLSAVLLFHADLPAGTLTVAAVDVGQGQCIVATQPGSAVMIDCGGINTDENAGDCAAAYLMGKGKRRLDLLVLTHLHADHVNGVERLFSRVKIDRLAMPADADDAGYTEKVLALAESHGTELYLVTENMEVSLGRLNLTLYAPLGSSSANERGVIILGKYADFEALVTGDADAQTETLLVEKNELPDIELLVVGHHGSRYSTSTALLDEAKPDVAFISVGWNTYGHPSETVLRRLADYGIPVYRTDTGGNLTLTVGGLSAR